MNFATTLKSLRTKADDVSRYKIWQYTEIDQSYLKALEDAVKTNPSRDLVILVAFGLVRESKKIEIYDIQALLDSAGYRGLDPIIRRESRESKMSRDSKLTVPA